MRTNPYKNFSNFWTISVLAKRVAIERKDAKTLCLIMKDAPIGKNTLKVYARDKL